MSEVLAIHSRPIRRRSLLFSLPHYEFLELNGLRLRCVMLGGESDKTVIEVINAGTAAGTRS
jgi:hypothetical protein